MKLGLELRRNQLDVERFRFARQCGCTHLVLRLATDFPTVDHRLGEAASVGGYGGAEEGAAPEETWTYDALARLTEQINAAGLQVEAVGGSGPIFPPGDRPSIVDVRRWRGRFKAIIRSVGGAGIPVLGYEADPSRTATGRQIRVGRGDAHASCQNRLERFLSDVLPVAEEAGVTLAAQIRRPAWCQRIMDLHPSARHALEFCVADFSESAGDGVYLGLEACLRVRRLACVRLDGTSADGAGVDIPRVVRLLRLGGYRGVILPDRTPPGEDAAAWRAEVARQLDALRAALRE